VPRQPLAPSREKAVPIWQGKNLYICYIDKFMKIYSSVECREGPFRSMHPYILSRFRGVKASYVS
jgi:hypothetical protein